MTNLVFKLGSFEVLVWHLVAVALLVVAIVLIIVGCRLGKKARKKNVKPEQQQETTQEQSACEEQIQAVDETTEQTSVQIEETAETAPTEAVVEQPSQPEQSDESNSVEEGALDASEEIVDDADEQEIYDEKGEETAVDEETADDEENVDDEETADDEVAEEEKPATVVKVYHISLRKDGLWQVKLGKGSRALKLFKTQAEAIVFAKEKAKNQDGRIVIHKVDGKIRKIRY